MDINLPSELNALRPSTATGGDLLAQLRAAGTIEAEVIKVLNDNLLLRSRLGDILTRNTLNYKTGDRLLLRLDERAATPVLKSSPAEPRPVSIETRAYPEIARLLSPERPVLAKVLRIVAQQAEIRLAQTAVRLPPQVTSRPGDLLRLVRDDSRQQIEITPLQAKVIYKSLIKQLVPATRDNGRTSLVRLYELLARAGGETRARTAEAPESLRQKPSVAAPAASRSAALAARVTGDSAQTPEARARPAATPAPTPPMDRRIPNARTETAVPPESPKTQTSKPAARGAENPQPPARSVGGNAINRNPVSADAAPMPRAVEIRQPGASAVTRANTSAGPGDSGAPSGPERPSVHTAPTPRNQAQPPSAMPPKPPPATSPQPGQPQAAPVSTPRTGLAAATTGLPPQAGTPASPAPAQPLAGAPGSANPNPPAAASGSLFDHGLKATDGRGDPAPLLNSLARLLPRLTQFDAASLQRWFQAAKLVDASATQSAPSMDIMRILARLGDGDGFARELGNLLAAEARSRAEAESQPARVPPEAPGPQIREGLKLIEQSLAQNLLQRATIGLQQETQQPLAFNLALPLLEHNEIKPLYIDLAQRKRAQDQSDPCWDIRIRFEFSALGPVCCHIMLEGSAVAASFYSERAATRADIDAALPELRRQLTDAGFEAGEFHSFSGGFKLDQAPLTAALGEALIDIEV